MKKLAVIILVFLSGVIITLWISKDGNTTISETELIYNGLKQVSKIQVTEGYFTEVHTYKDSKSYWNDLVSFDKKALVVVNAKAQVAYDLEKINIEIDSVQQRVILNHIPEAEVTIVPDISYYDIQQSSFNSFTAEDYNKIKDNLMIRLRENQIVTDLKEQAHDRLFQELSQLFVLSRVYQWEVIDNTNNVEFNFKD